MKKLLFLALCCTVVLSCSKESPVSTATEIAREESLAAERGPKCNTSLCSIRVNLPLDGFSVFHDFRVVKQLSALTWHGMLVSLECTNDQQYQNILANTWYPIYIEEGIQYHMVYTYQMPCTTQTLASGDATFTIRTATTETTYALHTGTTPSTNPDYASFVRYGCLISDLEIE